MGKPRARERSRFFLCTDKTDRGRVFTCGLEFSRRTMMQSVLNYLAAVRALNRNAKFFLLHTIFFGLSIALLALLYNLYVMSLNFKQDMIGTLTLLACVVAVVAALPLSVVLNRLGYQRTLIAAVLLTAFSMWLPLVFPVREALLACELFWGVGFTLLVIAGAPFMTENSNDGQRAQLFSLQFALTMLTAFVGYWVGGSLPRWFGAWLGVNAESPQAYQAALYVSVVLMLCSAVPFFFIRNRARAKHAAPVSPRVLVRRPTPAAKLVTPYIIGAAGAGMFVPFANVLWKTTQNVSDATIGNIFALSALLMVGAGVVLPFLLKRWGAVRAMLILQMIAIAGLLAFGCTGIFAVAVVGYWARDVMMNLVRPVYGQFMMEQSDAAERAAVSAVATMGFNLAWGTGSWVSGIWQSENQFAIVFIVSAGFGVLGIGTMYYFFGRTARAPKLENVTRPIGSPAE
jgi:MFS family permease